MTEYHIPDARLHQMISNWPPLQDVDAEKLADEIVPNKSTCAALRWMAQCYAMLPLDQTIISDYIVLNMLQRAAEVTTHTGIDGRRWVFLDGSSIVANSLGDKAYAPA